MALLMARQAKRLLSLIVDSCDLAKLNQSIINKKFISYEVIGF